MTEVLTYEALKADRDALAERVERLSGMLTESRHATKAAVERAEALAVENAALKAAGNKMFLSAISLMEDHDLKINHLRDVKDWERNATPATDAALAAISLEAKIEGANELAERIAEMHSKTEPGSNIEKKLMFAAEAAIAYANGLREAK